MLCFMRVLLMQLCCWLYISWASEFMLINYRLAFCEEGDEDLCGNFLTKAHDIATCK